MKDPFYNKKGHRKKKSYNFYKFYIYILNLKNYILKYTINFYFNGIHSF